MSKRLAHCLGHFVLQELKAQLVYNLSAFISAIELSVAEDARALADLGIHLGRQVVSRTGDPRAGMGSAGGLGERCDLP